MGNLLSSVKHTSDGVPYHTLKDFKLKERVGSGGYGTVLKMSELNRFALKKRIVAVKLFNGWDIYSKREIEILKTHTHEHIVQLFGVIWDEKDKDDPTKNPIYTGYVMEYLELGSLHKEIHDLSKSYDIALILLWVKQIGSGLHYLHGNGIIHRDVKPSNILLLRIDHIKLADFGLARNISYQQSCTTGPIGTNVYMAPEVTSKDYGVPADVYSFGITIWEITQRKDPSKHLKTSTDSSGIVSTELIMDADETYGGLTDLVKRCWQRNIFDRPSIQEIINFEPKFEQTILVMGDSDNNKMTLWNRKASTWTVSRMELPEDYILFFGVVYLDDELYLIGDDKSLFQLDKNMEWKQLADMNERRGYINNSCLEWNGYIWVYGGWNENREEVLKSVERYDPKEDKWTRMPDMKYGRYRAAAAVCNGKIYICGGIGDGLVYLKSVECFDPESGVWTELTDMPTPRLAHSLVCYRNKLVVIGGEDGKEWTTTVLELDPLEKNGQWKELSPLLYTSYASVGVVLGPEIFAISQASDNVQIFNGINWRVGPSVALSVALYSLPPSAVLVSQELADRLSCYPNDLKQ